MGALGKNSTITLGIPSMEDVALVARRCREADRRDMEGLHPGRTVRDIIFSEVCRSRVVYGLFREGRIHAIFGVVPLAGKAGCPWLVGTEDVERFPLPFARASRDLLDMLQRNYPLLDTFVCVENNQSILWHRWCGFEFEDEKIRLGRDLYYRAQRRAVSGSEFKQNIKGE